MDRRAAATASLLVAPFILWAIWRAGDATPPVQPAARTADGSKAGASAESPRADASAEVPVAPEQPTRRPRRRVEQPDAETASLGRARNHAAGWMDATLVEMSGPTAVDLAEDIDSFREHFETEAPGPVVDGADAPAVAAATDGTTLRFAKGCHVWETRALNERDRWPRHLTVAGAGMDATLVRISEEISSRGELTALTLRDLTIHCDDDGLTDLRSTKPATIRLVRCRVIGFDAGHGGCDLFNGNVGAFLAEDSRIELGFGRSPGSTELFDVRGGACVARLERCKIVGPFDCAMFWTDPNQAFVLVGCELRDMSPSSRSEIEANSSVVLRNCKVTYVADGYVGPSDPRPVSELNPAWVLPQIPPR